MFTNLLEYTPLKLWILLSVSMHFLAGQFLFNSNKANPEFTIQQSEFSIEANFIEIKAKTALIPPPQQSSDLNIIHNEFGLIEELVDASILDDTVTLTQFDKALADPIVENMDSIPEEFTPNHQEMIDPVEAVQNNKINDEKSFIDTAKDSFCEFEDSLPAPDLSGATDYIPPSVIANPEPKYPHKAKIAGHQGTVRLSIKIDPLGNPESVQIITSSGYKELDDRAQSTVLKKWRFKAAQKNGQKMNSELTMSLKFRLKGIIA